MMIIITITIIIIIMMMYMEDKNYLIFYAIHLVGTWLWVNCKDIKQHFFVSFVCCILLLCGGGGGGGGPL